MEGKKTRQSQASCTRLFIQHGSLCRGGWGRGRCQGGYQHRAGAAAHPAAEANHNLPVAARAGCRAPASLPRHRERNQALTASGEQCLLQMGVQARSSTTSAPINERCKEPRHTQRDAATRLGDRGTKRCQSPGPGRIEMLEGLSSPASQGRRRTCAAGNLQHSDGSSSSSPHTGMLLPHHPPRFAPSGPETWQCPPRHIRISPPHPFQPRTPACGTGF